MTCTPNRFRHRCLQLTAVFFLTTALSSSLAAQVDRSDRFKRDLNFGRIDMMALEGGRSVVKIPRSDDGREVVVVGAIRIQVPLDTLVDYFRDAESFYAGDGIVTQIGAFDGQPSSEQLKRMRLPKGDFEALRRCEVGDCKVKLTRDWIEAMKDIDWSSPARDQLASAAMVKALVQYLDAYLAGGNAALPIYHDKFEPLAAGDGFARLHARSRRYLRGADSLWVHMRRFPEARSRGVEDRFFWMVEDFGLRPVMSLNHMMIYRDSAVGGDHATVAVKQIYASHYLQGLVKIATLVPASERYPDRATYLVLSVQLRFDSNVGGLKRALLKRELEHTWTRHLLTLKDRAEMMFRNQETASTQDG